MFKTLRLFSVHEGTIVEATKMIISWIWATNGKHSELDAFFSKSFSNMKGNVRTAFCSLISKGSTAIGISSDEQLLELCAKTYEKSYAQITQV